jgi:hypothetical protein
MEVFYYSGLFPPASDPPGLVIFVEKNVSPLYAIEWVFYLRPLAILFSIGEVIRSIGSFLG